MSGKLIGSIMMIIFFTIEKIDITTINNLIVRLPRALLIDLVTVKYNVKKLFVFNLIKYE